MSRAGSAKRSIREAPTLNSHGWLLWGLAARMAARTSASGPSLGSLRQRRHGSYAGPSPALHTPCSHARQTPPAAASTAPVPRDLERCASVDLHATRQRPRRTNVVTSPLARLATRIAWLLVSALKRRPAATLTPLGSLKRAAPAAPSAWPGAPAPRSVRHSPVRGP